MSAKDIVHDAVKQALIKDGWTITHDPLFIRIKGVQMYIDLGAERNGEKIAIEIKSFQGESAINEFHSALGQSLNYRQALSDQDPVREVYLAIP